MRLPGPDGGRLQELRAFKATTAGLLGLADWLDSYQVTLVSVAHGFLTLERLRRPKPAASA